MQKIIRVVLSLIFVFGNLIPQVSFAQAGEITSVQLLGIKVDPQNPFLLDFIFDSGNRNISQETLNVETSKMIHYFLAALTLPKKDQWVNLSPTEQERIIPQNLGVTDLGRDMIQEDFILKQTAASLTNPETELGEAYWQALNHRPDNRSQLLSKIWIVPDQAVVVETNQGTFVQTCHMKVKLLDDSSDSQVFRRTILPVIEKQVNYGQEFGTLQQIYHAMILAVWYKQQLQDNLLTQVYADQAKVSGIDRVSPQKANAVYQQYLSAFKQGAYRVVVEEPDALSGEMIPRKYFSGGLEPVGQVAVKRRPTQALPPAKGQLIQSTVKLNGLPKASSGIVKLEPMSVPAINSAFEVGQRNTVGTFMPLQQVRSRRDWGIGDFAGMMQVVDLHAALGQTLIQVLPLNQSSADNSPYSVKSSLMFDEIYISPEQVAEKYNSPAAQQFIVDHQDKIKALHDRDEVDFNSTRQLKREFLKVVWQSVKQTEVTQVQEFLARMNFSGYGNLQEHILYGVLKDQYLQKEAAAGVHWTRSRMWDWRLWEEKIRDRDPQTLSQLTTQYRDEIEFEAFVQMLAYEQFLQLRDYGRKKGVSFMVDIPYALDGADLWINPAVFGLKKENGYRAMTKQGVPPEPAYKGGQYWQFFPYDWSYSGTVPFIRKRYELTQDLTDAQRLDHVLGFYRQFRFIEDVQGQLNLKNLDLYPQVLQIQQAAIRENTPEAKSRAVEAVRSLILNKLRSFRDQLPPALAATLPGNAMTLLMDERGQLFANHLIQIARPVSVEDYATPQAPGAWQRQYVAEGSVFNNQQKWDMIRITPDTTLNDQGFLYEYLFGEGSGSIQPTDSLRPAYFELSPGDALMTQFLAMAQARGSVLVWETLGVVPAGVQSSVDKLGGVNYNPGIWGDEKYWGSNPNPYHYDHHLPNSYATLSLHDSSTEKVRWEQEIPRHVKEGLLNEWFGVGQWSPDDMQFLTKRVQDKLLEKYIYASPARVGVAAWVDLLGLGDDYRLNSPGRQGGQWQKRLPKEMEVENLLAASRGEGSVALASEVTDRIKRLSALGQRGNEPVSAIKAGEIVHINPQVGSQMVQMRRIDEPFLVDAYIQQGAQSVDITIRSAQGQEETLSMDPVQEDLNRQQTLGVSAQIQKWSVRFHLTQPGDYQFFIKTVTAGGQQYLSSEGHLTSVSQYAQMNPLSDQYLKTADASKAWAVDGYELSDGDLFRIKQNFLEHMRRKQEGLSSSLGMLNTYLSAATGQEEGEYVALDWGGTNFRAMRVELKPGQAPHILQIEKVPFTEAQKTGSLENLWDIIVGQVKKLDLNPAQQYSLGFTVGFPIEQEGLAHGRISVLNKEWDVKGLVGLDLVSGLAQALKQRGVNHVKPVVVLNDTVGTQLTVPQADLGMILGTGWNFSFLDPSRQSIVNVESGAFDAVAQTQVDRDILSELKPEGWHAIEKMVSGIYLGEIVRRELQNLHEQKKWMANVNIPGLSQVESLETQVISHIDGQNDRTSIRDYIKEINLWGLATDEISDQDINLLQQVVRQISQRAGALVAAGIIAAVELRDPQLQQNHLIAVDGSVYEKHPHMARYIEEGLIYLVGQQRASQIQLTLTKDGSGMGAAIAAAIAASKTASSGADAVGGIDLNPDELKLQVQRRKDSLRSFPGNGLGPWANLGGLKPVLMRTSILDAK